MAGEERKEKGKERKELEWQREERREIIVRIGGKQSRVEKQGLRPEEERRGKERKEKERSRKETGRTMMRGHVE